MHRSFRYTRIFLFLPAIFLLITGMFSFSTRDKNIVAVPPAKHDTLVIHVMHMAGGRPFNPDSTYTNQSGETYRVTKWKYYLSNFRLDGKRVPDTYFLVNAFDPQDIVLPMRDEKLKTISFLIGVDSARNNSGAQTGALDPMNDMFWTWNSGYVMFKLEGSSASSTGDLKRIEHHLGGYEGPYKAMRMITLNLPEKLKSKESGIIHLTLEVNLDAYWGGEQPLRIADHPLITTKGTLASQAADHLPAMFSILPATD